MSTQNDPRDPLLDPLLDKIRPPDPPPITREVWNRIAADRVRTPSLREEGVWAAIEGAFRQPAFAVAFVVACGLFGLLLAEIRVSRMHHARDVQLVQSYMRLIDPLLAASDTTAMSQNGRTP